MKRFFTFLLCFCIVFSSFVLSSFADDLNVSNVSNIPFAILNQLSINGWINGQTGLDQQVFLTSEYLPILDHSGRPIASHNNDTFCLDYLRITLPEHCSGYYSLYCCFDFQCNSSNAVSTSNLISYFQTLDLYNSSTRSNYSPVVNLYQKSNFYVQPMYNYLFSIWVKWDFPIEDIDQNCVLECSGYSDSFSLPLNYYIISASNVSLVKYVSENAFDYSEDLLNIATELTTTNSNLENYLPQIITRLNYIHDDLDHIADDFGDYLNSIDLSNSDILNFLTNDLDDYLTTLVDYSYSIYNFLNDNFTVNHDHAYNLTIWEFLEKLYISLCYTGGSNTNSIYYHMIQQSFRNNNFFSYDRNSNSGTFNGRTSFDAFNGIFDALKSINDLLVFEYFDKEDIKNSDGYQTGESILNLIISDNGYSGISGLTINFSGFGDSSNIGSMFNGLNGAFSWFSNSTKNDIDAVPAGRITNNHIVDFIHPHYDEIQEIIGDNND